MLRTGTSLINRYLVADDDGVILVDAGAPRYRSQLEPGLAQLGRDLDDVRAVLLTPATPTTRASPRSCVASGVPVLVHSADEELTRTGRDDGGRRASSPISAPPQPEAPEAGFVRRGRPVHLEEVENLRGLATSSRSPADPALIHAPGHSPVCVALHFEARSLLFVGDVLFE